MIEKYSSSKGKFYAFWRKAVTRELERYVAKYIKANSRFISAVSLDQTTKYQQSVHDIVGQEDEKVKQELLTDTFINIVNNPKNEFTQMEKQIIKLYLVGFSLPEISKKMEWAISTVYKFYRSAVAKIGRVLKEQKK